MDFVILKSMPIWWHSRRSLLNSEESLMKFTWLHPLHLNQKLQNQILSLQWLWMTLWRRSPPTADQMELAAVDVVPPRMITRSRGPAEEHELVQPRTLEYHRYTCHPKK